VIKCNFQTLPNNYCKYNILTIYCEIPIQYFSRLHLGRAIIVIEKENITIIVIEKENIAIIY